MTLALPCGLLCAAMAAAAPGTDASLPKFGRCLAGHGVSTTLVAGQRLELAARLPATTTLDAAFTACRQHVRWPRDFAHVGRALYSLRDHGRRFRSCMREHGRDPGRPILFLGSIGIGLHFTKLNTAPPPDCARLLPGGLR